MMTSSGLGPYRVGGLEPLSSSVSLSPLAPPFNVDQSLQKQNSTSNSVNYPKVPQPGPYFDPASQLWKYSSSASGSNFEVTESMETSSNLSSYPGVYGYPGSQPRDTVASDHHTVSFLYDPFPSSMSTSKDGVKSNYSPHVVSPSQKDCYLSLGVGSGHDNDFLSNTSSAHSSGCGPSASDQPQGMSTDGIRKLNWGSFRSGVNEQEKGFQFKDLKPSDLSSSRKSFLYDGTSKSQPFIDVYARPFDDGSNKINHHGGNTSNLKQDACFTIFGGPYHLGSLGIDPQDSASLSGCSKVSNPASIRKESPLFQEPIAESVTKYCGSQNANDHFSRSSLFVFGGPSTTSSFPITMDYKSQYDERRCSEEGTHSAWILDPKVSVVPEESNISAGLNYSYPIEPCIPLELKFQSSNIIKRPLSSVVSSSSQCVDNRFTSNDGFEISQVSPNTAYQSNSDCLDLKANNIQAAYHVENSHGGSDVHNLTEDSPCWRGTSSDRFSSLSMPEGMAPDVFVEQFDEDKSLRFEHMKSFPVETSDCKKLFSEKVIVRNLSEAALVPECISNDNIERCSVIREPFCFDLNTGHGLQFADDGFVSTKEGCIMNKPKANSQTGTNLAAIHISEGVKIKSPRQMSKEAAFEGSANCPPMVANNSLCSKNDHASSPPGDNASLKHCQVSSKISDSNVDVDMLLELMTNLSEVLRSHCFSKRASIPHHSIAIKHVIANLNASMLMMARETFSTIPSLEVNDAAVKLGGSADCLLGSVSSKDDSNTIGGVHMTEATKKVLHENFLVEQEIDEQQLLYKSLWLDAEASLCTMTAKARFLRVKAEMEKSATHYGSKERDFSSRSNAFGDVHGTVDLATSCHNSSMPIDWQKSCTARKNNHDELPEVNKCHISNTKDATDNPVESKESKTIEEEISFLSLDASRQGKAANVSDCSGSTSHVNNVEASVMPKFQILNSLIENSEAVTQECQDSSGGHKDPSSLYASCHDSHGIWITSDAMNKYQILKCRANHDSLNNDRNSSLGEDNYLPDRDSSSTEYQILECGVDNSNSFYKSQDSQKSQNSQLLTNSVGAPKVREASVLDRFRILQSRINLSSPVDKEQAVEHGTDGLGMLEKQSNVLKGAFGPYPKLPEDDGNQSGSPGLNLWNPYDNPTRLNNEIFESWYGNDCSFI